MNPIVFAMRRPVTTMSAFALCQCSFFSGSNMRRAIVHLVAMSNRAVSSIPTNLAVGFEFNEPSTVIATAENVAKGGTIGACLEGLIVLLLLGGLAPGIGLLVNDVTVDVENVHAQTERTHNITSAALHGNLIVAGPRRLRLVCVPRVFVMREPLFSSFVPMMLGIGRAMIASYLLSSTFVPVVVATIMSDLGKTATNSVGSAIIGVGERLRSILMTAGAMTVGMVPLALALEKGSKNQAPLGLAVIGGLVVSTCATLLMLPTVFAMVIGRRAYGFALVYPKPGRAGTSIHWLSLVRNSSRQPRRVKGPMSTIWSGATRTTRSWVSREACSTKSTRGGARWPCSPPRRPARHPRLRPNKPVRRRQPDGRGRPQSRVQTGREFERPSFTRR